MRLCARRGIRVLAHGALMGGLLADDWLGADPHLPECVCVCVCGVSHSNSHFLEEGRKKEKNLNSIQDF